MHTHTHTQGYTSTAKQSIERALVSVTIAELADSSLMYSWIDTREKFTRQTPTVHTSTCTLFRQAYLCILIHMYAHLFQYTYVYVHMHVLVMYIITCTYVCQNYTHTYVCAPVSIHIRICTYVCIGYVHCHLYICMPKLYSYICMCTCFHTHVCTYVCMGYTLVHVCTYAHTYVQQQKNTLGEIPSHPYSW